MQQATLRTAGAIAFTFLMASCAYSQTLNLWPGAAPGVVTKASCGRRTVGRQGRRSTDQRPLGIGEP